MASSLRDRLKDIIGTPQASRTPVALPPLPPHTESAPLCDTLGGCWRETDDGQTFVVSRRFPAEAPYGSSCIGAYASELRTSAASAVLVGPGATAPPFLFFDLETTGLNGGAGTSAFIVGCGWFDEEDGFVVEQHLLVDYGRERAMLRLVAHELARSGAIVTFNGKSFDAPVLETRYLFHRLPSPCHDRPHLDVLHPARRFWSDAVDSCSLVALESELLGARRHADVPGFEIPSRYFQFVRSGDAQPLAGVLEHNRLDLVSLAGITATLLRLLHDGVGKARNAREALALGRLYERAGMEERARAAFTCALETARAERRASAAAITVDALKSLALAARRRREFPEAARSWHALLDMPACPPHIAREAIEALAIHHEHRVRDLRAAKAFAERSVAMSGERARGDAARHRLARIEQKLVSEPLPLFPSLPPLPPSSAFPTSAPRTSS